MELGTEVMSAKSINLNSTAPRAVILVFAVLCVAAAYFFAKWFLANTIATRVIYKEVADIAVNLAPADPQTRYASAVLHEKTFQPGDFEKSLAEYEQAVANSPYDFRLWLELGRARDRAGESGGAEKALRRAAALAPHYSAVQWTLGNFLLRQGSEAEAFAEIRKAAESDKSFANPAIASAWQLFGGDTARVKDYVGDSNNLKAAFASLLAREKRFEEASQVWNELPEAARRGDYKANGEEIYQKMLEARKYRSALRVSTDLAADADNGFAVGRITNGGFEASVPKNPSVFEWQFAEGVEPQIGIDNQQKRGGNISLKLIFNSADGKAFRPVTQSVAVEPGKRYTFETFYKSELATRATVKWEISDAADNKILAATEPIAANADWTSLKAEFTVPETTEAVTVRLVRVPCTTALCPISGKLWFDDFVLN